MSAWGTGPFENDDAGELETRLCNEGRKAITAALRGTKRIITQDEGRCSAAIAASEVIAAANGHPLRGFAAVAAEAAAWVRDNAYQPTPQLTAQAMEIITAISDASALADLWREAGSLAAWRRTLQSLTKRLLKPATFAASATPPPPPARPRPRPAATAPSGSKKTAAISIRAANTLLMKKADGALFDHRAPALDVLLRQLRKLSLKDATALATLPDVRKIELTSLKLSPDKRGVLTTLLEGWDTASSVDLSDTEKVASLVCPMLRAFSKLTSVWFAGSDLTDAAFATLGTHPTIKDLDLSGTKISAAVLDQAGKLPALERLALHACPAITIADAARFAVANSSRIRLAFTPNSKELGLTQPSAARQKACAKQNNPIQDLASQTWNVWVNVLEGHLGFGELPDLDRLAFMAENGLVDAISIGINDCPIRHEDADRLRFVLASWPDIQQLTIANSTSLNDSMTGEIARFQKLELLEVDQAAVSDAMLAAIAALPKLRRLSLTGTAITSKSLSRIARLPHLRWLTLSESPALPRKDILALRKKLAPNCYVECL